jgi:hypothetical protein
MCSAETGLTAYLYTMLKEEFSVSCYMCATCILDRGQGYSQENPSSRQRGCHTRAMTVRILWGGDLVMRLKTIGAVT